MKPVPLSVARWVQPVTIGGKHEPVTTADAATTLTALEYGITIVRAGKRVLVPWCNVKQADE